jgi:hypothetical protein
VVPGEDEADAPLVVLAAAKIGTTRLIDNLEFQANKEYAADAFEIEDSSRDSHALRIALRRFMRYR